MGKLKQYIKRRGIFILMLLAGLYCLCLALWNLSNTLLYTHKAVVLPATVRDVRQRPFDSWTEALRYGNLPWEGDIAYKPILTVTMPNGIRIRALTAPDLDNRDYQLGEQVELITHPYDPNQAHVNKWKFLWGADTMLLALGAVLVLPAWLVLFPRRRPATRKTQPQPRTAQTPQPAKTQPRRAPEPDLFSLPTETAPQTPTSPKKRAPRKKKEADPDAPKKPRAPRKKKEVDPTAPPKPRKPRKKKTEQ